MSKLSKRPRRTLGEDRRSKSAGFTLLEIILALAILAGSLAALGEVMRLADQTASLTEGESQAQIYAASIMDELLSGARQLEDVSQATLNEDDDIPWVYSIETDKTNLDQLVSVRVSVEQKLDARLQPAHFDLTRFMPNPDYTPPDASGQSNSSTTSSSTSNTTTPATGGQK